MSHSHLDNDICQPSKMKLILIIYRPKIQIFENFRFENRIKLVELIVNFGNSTLVRAINTPKTKSLTRKYGIGPGWYQRAYRSLCMGAWVVAQDELVVVALFLLLTCFSQLHLKTDMWLDTVMRHRLWLMVTKHESSTYESSRCHTNPYLHSMIKLDQTLSKTQVDQNGPSGSEF